MGSSVHSPKNQNLLFSLINILLLFFMGRTFLLSSLPLTCSSVPIQAGQFWWCFVSCIAVALPAVQSKLLPFHLLHLAWQFSFPVTSRNQRQVFTWNSSQNLWGPVLLKSHAKPNDNYFIFFFFFWEVLYCNTYLSIKASHLFLLIDGGSRNNFSITTLEISRIPTSPHVPQFWSCSSKTNSWLTLSSTISNCWVLCNPLNFSF